MNSGVIKLNGSATPMRAGRLGEVIQLKTINSKKIIIGRITNFNEVEVEL
jgi:flagella basal body P-ring formation protein FlgA